MPDQQLGVLVHRGLTLRTLINSHLDSGSSGTIVWGCYFNPNARNRRPNVSAILNYS